MNVIHRLLVIMLGVLVLPIIAAAPLDDDTELTREEQRWLERLPRVDADAVGQSVNWVAPEFPDSTRWLGADGPTLASLRGKVVLVQTFATRGSGRSAATRLPQAIKPFADQDDFIAIAVHTPEDLDRIDALLPKLNLDVPILVDEKGEWCDSVGAFRRPVAYLIDRQGTVRYASVSARSVEDAATKLLAEQYIAESPIRERATKTIETSEEIPFPTFTTSVGSSTDQRGKKAPEFYVEEVWKQPAGDATGKVAILDFWATWCGPCRDAIPHMNEIQNHYGTEVICLGISDETDFERGMMKRSLKANNFDYGLAIDTSSTLKTFFGVRGIPHVAVLSGDWVVRWQGHPSNLNRDTLDSIVQANRALQALQSAESGDSGPPPQRWKAWLAKQSSRGH